MKTSLTLWPRSWWTRRSDEGGQHGSGVRQLTAFVGGIDVTNGRYDTGRHSLFRTLDFEHSDDMHQPCIPGANIKFGGGPQSRPICHCTSRPCSPAFISPST